MGLSDECSRPRDEYERDIVREEKNATRIGSDEMERGSSPKGVGGAVRGGEKK